MSNLTVSSDVDSLLACANNAAMRTALGLVIGTDVQAYDAALTTLAGKTLTGSGNLVCAVAPTFASGTITTSAPVVVSQAWNAIGVTFVGVDINITRTASASGSMLQRWRDGGTDLVVFYKDGAITASGVITGTGVNGVQSTGAVVAAKGNSFRFGTSGGSLIADNGTDGQLVFFNGAANNFGRVMFGGTTSSFPALKRNSAELQARVADDTAFTFVEDLYRRKGSGSPEGVVTAPVGAIYHRTDGGAGTSTYTKESGAGNTGWVPK